MRQRCPSFPRFPALEHPFDGFQPFLILPEFDQPADLRQEVGEPGPDAGVDPPSTHVPVDPHHLDPRVVDDLEVDPMGGSPNRNRSPLKASNELSAESTVVRSVVTAMCFDWTWRQRRGLAIAGAPSVPIVGRKAGLDRDVPNALDTPPESGNPVGPWKVGNRGTDEVKQVHGCCAPARNARSSVLAFGCLTSCAMDTCDRSTQMHSAGGRWFVFA